MASSAEPIFHECELKSIIQLINLHRNTVRSLVLFLCAPKHILFVRIVPILHNETIHLFGVQNRPKVCANPFFLIIVQINEPISERIYYSQTFIQHSHEIFKSSKIILQQILQLVGKLRPERLNKLTTAIETHSNLGQSEAQPKNNNIHELFEHFVFGFYDTFQLLLKSFRLRNGIIIKNYSFHDMCSDFMLIQVCSIFFSDSRWRSNAFFIFQLKTNPQ